MPVENKTLTDGFLCFPPRGDKDQAQWSNIQRKAQYPAVYHCSINSNHASRNRWVERLDDSNRLKSDHKALLATWYPQPSWAPPVLWQVMGGGLLGTKLAPIAVLAMFHLPHVTSLQPSSSNLVSVSFLCAILMPLCHTHTQSFLFYCGILSNIFFMLFASSISHSLPPSSSLFQYSPSVLLCLLTTVLLISQD